MDEERAVWSTAYVNGLPDSAFLYIEPGGTKDDGGKTVPRSKRHFPVRDANGNVDMAHLRNAMSRIPQSDLPQSVKDRCAAKAQRLMDQMNRSEDVAVMEEEFERRGTDLWPDTDLEIRTTGDGLTLEGYAAVFDRPSKPIPSPRGTFIETIHPGAFSRTLAAKPDVTLRYQHNLMSLPLGRTASGTLTLAEDDRGLLVSARLPDNEVGRPIRDAIQRRDISGMSFSFRVPTSNPNAQKWGEGTRDLFELQIGPEVSVVDYPAYPDTSVLVRALQTPDVPIDALTEAVNVLLDPDAPLTREQRDLLWSQLNHRLPPEERYVSPKLAAMRERLAARAS